MSHREVPAGWRVVTGWPLSPSRLRRSTSQVTHCEERDLIPTCILVGGFLGAGKTTALLCLAERYAATGRRVALVTNDQGQDLVDTRIAASRAVPVAEITGGCFCCRFDSLVDSFARLSRDTAPDLVLAEPVGSCTDVRATVLNPLARLHGGVVRTAPYSVLVDPWRAAVFLGIDTGAGSAPDVQYIFQTQLADADLIVLTKRDAIDETKRNALERGMRSRFPGASVLTVSARTGEHVDVWMRSLATPAGPRAVADVDYDRYAAGEALLGWLNGRWSLSAATPFDGNAFVRRVAVRAQRALRTAGAPIAHLKAALAVPGLERLAVVNAVNDTRPPEVSWSLPDRTVRGELVVNLRAEGDPLTLGAAMIEAVHAAASHAGIDARLADVDQFRPQRPVPTHRLDTP